MAYPIEPLSFHGVRPSKAHEDDAAFDLKAGPCRDTPPFQRLSGHWILDPGETRLIPTGTELEIPEGFVGLICSRSGLALNRGLFILNAPGVIDPGYRGDIGVVMHNLGPGKAVIRPGDRIAQLLILPNSNFRMVERTSLSTTERGTDGFGSTGISSAPLWGRADLPDAS